MCTTGKGVADALVNTMQVSERKLVSTLLLRRAEFILSLCCLYLQTFYDKANYQDSLVDGAEIEAAYEHSRNLLHKQCAIYDQVVNRCAVNLGIRSGCDG